MRLTQSSKATVRTRVSAGRDALPNVDGRSIVARRFRDIVAAVCSDQGGPDRMAEVRLQLVRRFAAAAVLAKSMEAKLARGEQIDISEHALLSSTLTRLAQRIGLNRIPRNIVPDLHDYLESKTNVTEAAE